METGVRPRAVILIALASVIGTLGNVVPLFRLERQAEFARSFGVSPVLVITLGVELLALWVASGVGVWMGSRFGWWVAAIVYQDGMYRYARAAYIHATSEPGSGPEDVVYHLMGLVVFGILCGALYANAVRAWVGLSHWSRTRLVSFSLAGVAGQILLRRLAEYLLRP